MFKPLAALAALLLSAGCAHAPAPAVACGVGGPMTCGPHALRAAARTDKPATHGMLIVGNDTVYLSHLPMFHAPHDYQVIVEAKLTRQADYVADRRKTGTKIYTLVPEPFVLPDVIQNKKSFSATVFRGHFERGGVAIAEHVTVAITRVLLFKQFDPTAHQPRGLDYFLFGNAQEQFLAHLIVAPPDYDQVVQVQGQVPPAGGVAVTATGRTHDQFASEGQTLALDGGPKLAVGTEFYHETGDLAD